MFNKFSMVLVFSMSFSLSAQAFEYNEIITYTNSSINHSINQTTINAGFFQNIISGIKNLFNRNNNNKNNGVLLYEDHPNAIAAQAAEAHAAQAEAAAAEADAAQMAQAQAAQGSNGSFNKPEPVAFEAAEMEPMGASVNYTSNDRCNGPNAHLLIMCNEGGERSPASSSNSIDGELQPLEAMGSNSNGQSLEGMGSLSNEDLKPTGDSVGSAQ